MRLHVSVLVALFWFPLLAQITPTSEQLEAEARQRLAARDANGALALYEKLGQLAPKSAAYQDEIGFLLAATMMLAGTQKAIPELTKASKQLPRDARVWEALGLALQKQNRFNEARRAYNHAIELDPSNTSLRNDYAYALVKSGNPMGGFAQFRKILEREPDNVHVQVNIGYAYIGAGDYKEAIKQLSQVVRDHPNAGDAYYDLGVAYKQSDDLSNARTQLERAVKLSPSLAEAHYVLATTYIDLGERQKAIEQLRAAVPSRRSGGPCRLTVQTREPSIRWGFSSAVRAIRKERNKPSPRPLHCVRPKRQKSKGSWRREPLALRNKSKSTQSLRMVFHAR